MNAQRQTNTFSGGMNMDVDYSTLKENQYIYAENVRVLTNEGLSAGAMQNIEGFLTCTPTLNLSSETIIHTNQIREWGIVITQSTSDTTKFSVYRYDFSGSDDDIPTVTQVVSLRALGIEQTENEVWAISSVLRWESSTNIKMYFTDGVNQMKMIYVDDDHIEDNASITSDSITILPAADFPQLQFNGFGSGNLNAGMIQYTYQLFKTRGPESAIAPLTNMFYLTADDTGTDSTGVMGNSSTQSSNKSVNLRTAVTATAAFDRIRIISIYYASKNDEPTITIVDECDLPSSGSFYYEDKGGSSLSELTVDEFNALTGYLFTAGVIEAKDNYLFAANITEDTWDIDYDARAYRCDSSGSVKLKSNSGSTLVFDYSEISTYDVDEEHDCICPYNSDSDEDYQYTQDTEGNYIYGGCGKNISYRFVQVPLVGDESTITSGTTYDYVPETFNIPVSENSTSTLLYTFEGSDLTNVTTSLVGSSEIPNYASSEITSKVTGYMRDEIYRFGIVFYNAQGVASPVHWIADIRMPSNRDSNYTFFEFGATNRYGSNMCVGFNALGIRFAVSNLPDDVVRFEIVRCERTVSDRTILSQGIVSCVSSYTTEEGDTNTLLPFPYLAYSDQHGYYGYEHYDSTTYKYSFDLASTQSDNYYMFISPDICVNRDDSEVIVDKFQSIEKQCLLYSPIRNLYSAYWSDYADLSAITSSSPKVLANARYTNNNGTIEENSSTIYGNNGFLVDVSDEHRIVLGGGEDSFYVFTLAKYYALYLGSSGTATIDAAKYIGPADDPFIASNAAGAPWINTTGVTVGDKIYYNWAWQGMETAEDDEVDETDANNVRKIGPHGICAIFQSDDMQTYIPLASSSSIARYTNAVMLCNMKQSVTPYGGDSYSARQNSVYISTGAVYTSSSTYAYTFGGDTYLGIFDYNNVMMCFDPEDYTTYSQNRIYNGAFFPVETTINLNLLQTEQAVSRTYQTGQYYSNPFMQDDITIIGTLYTQKDPAYAYNDAYSAQPVAREFVPASIYDISNLVTDTRIMASELKTNNEVTDSWCKFLVANYIDLDTRFGPITEMTLFKNNLMVWQQDAFGTVAVNERSLITDENPGALTLGTGGILTRYDYFTTKNGLSQDQLRADTQSDSTVYWYDAKRAEICGFDGQLQTVSKLKGVQSYLNEGNDSFVADPITVYDKKYNEALFTLDGEKTLAFNEQVGAFTSFYTFVPDYYIEFSDRVYFFDDLTLYKLNGGEDAEMITGEDKIVKMHFVVNSNYAQTKTFDNVEYGGDFTYGTNFNEIYFETKRQTSEVLDDEDIDYREDTYKFCIPRNSIELTAAEELVNKSYQDRMKGKYLICYYQYDSNDGNVMKVPYISTAYRISWI